MEHIVRCGICDGPIGRCGGSHDLSGIHCGICGGDFGMCRGRFHDGKWPPLMKEMFEVTVEVEDVVEDVIETPSTEMVEVTVEVTEPTETADVVDVADPVETIPDDIITPAPRIMPVIELDEEPDTEHQEIEKDNKKKSKKK